METNLILLPRDEARRRHERVASLLTAAGIDALLACTTVSIYYLTGRVFAGYVYLTASGRVISFIRRPLGLEGDDVVYIRKPEQIPDTLRALGTVPSVIGLEMGTAGYAVIERLKKAFEFSNAVDCSGVLSAARAVKTPYETAMIRRSGAKHDLVYSLIPSLYRPGMSDIDLQIAVECEMRRQGCLGQLRVNGDSMEIHMGNLLAGDNADVPSPYDFTMGGAGLDPSIPVGADGTIIHSGQTVMADMNGNFDGYMTDLSRTFALGDLPERAVKAHRLSIDICHALALSGKPGTEVKALYDMAEDMVKEAGLTDYFMGHRQKAPFIGHGVGIEINEPPVVTARSRDILAEGNVLALEPKFVIPGVGAVGIENTYLVTAAGLESFNHAPEEIIYF